MPERIRVIGTAAVAATAAVLIDQSTKWLLLEQLMQPPRVIPIASFLSLTLGFNTGISFGMFGETFARSPYLLSGVLAAIVALICVILWRTRSVWEAAGYGLIIGGAIGNIADRLRLGAVVDFIDLHYAGWHWPAFNTADVAIFCGAALLLLAAARRAQPTSQDPEPQSAGAQHVSRVDNQSLETVNDRPRRAK